MNLVAAIERMEAAGMDPANILLAVKCMAAEMESPLEKRRSADRERQARHRQRNVTNVSNVTECDNPSPLVPPLSPAPLSPPIIPPTRSELPSAGALEQVLRDAAGWQNEPHPGLFVTGPIEALLENGADLNLDVIPVIRGRAKQVRRPSGWSYFIGPIQDAQAKRLAAATGPPASSKPLSPKPSLQQLMAETGWKPGTKAASIA